MDAITLQWKRKWKRRTLLSLVAAVLASLGASASPVSAQSISDWGLVDALPGGARVRITRASGERHAYLFRRATADTLVVTRATGTGADEFVPKSDVTKVVRQGVRDSSGDGAAIGALAGFGIGVGLMALAYANACDTCDPPTFWALGGPAGAVGAGGGALVGYLIDRKREGSQLLYLAASATGGSGGAGRAGRAGSDRLASMPYQPLICSSLNSCSNGRRYRISAPDMASEKLTNP